MHNSHINLPSKPIQYIHTYVMKKTLGHLTLNVDKVKDIIQYIDWFNTQHKVDAQWLEIAETIIRQYKLPIIFYFRAGFQRLASDKNISVMRKLQKQVKRLIWIICDLIRQIQPSCTLRNFGFKFLEARSFKFQNSQDFPYDQIPPIRLRSQQRLLYHIVYDFKVTAWKCQRAMKKNVGSSDQFSSQISKNEIQFSKIDNVYAEIRTRLLYQFNLFQLNFLDDNFQRYKKEKQNYIQYMKCCRILEKQEKPVIELYNQNQRFQRLVKDSNDLFQQLKTQVDSDERQHENDKVSQGQSTESVQIIEQGQLIQETYKNGDFMQTTHYEQIIVQRNKEPQIQEGELIVYDRLCCRQFFIRGQRVGPQALDVQYKHYGFPWNQNLLIKLGKTICGFLNSCGGNIYIGVQENQQFIHRVVGQRYTEVEKQEVYKTIREIAQTIKPNIIVNRLIDVKFIPIISKQTNQNMVPAVIKNYYVIKISINQGIDSRIYTMSTLTNEEVYVRTENQVLRYQNMHQILDFQYERLKNNITLKPLYPHQNPCNNRKYQNSQKLSTIQEKKQIKKPLKTQIKLDFSSNTSNTTEDIRQQKFIAIAPGQFEKNISTVNNIHQIPFQQMSKNPFNQLIQRQSLQQNNHKIIQHHMLNDSVSSQGFERNNLFSKNEPLNRGCNQFTNNSRFQTQSTRINGNKQINSNKNNGNFQQNKITNVTQLCDKSKVTQPKTPSWLIELDKQ